MGLREDLLRRINRKEEEAKELRQKVRDTEAYIQGLEDALRMLPRDPGSPTAANDSELRAGTGLAQARDSIRAAGKPLHILEILKAMGRPTDKKNRISLSGNLAAYVRRGEVFTRPAPNTFGLIEFGAATKPPALEPPEGFGVEPEKAEEAEAVVKQEPEADDDVPF